MRTTARLGAISLITALLVGGCLADPYTGSYVVVDFLTDLSPSAIVQMPDGTTSHYEMWVQFDDQGVISLGKFSVDVNGHVLAYPGMTERIGSLTGADDRRRSGVEWDSPYQLEGVTSAFVTIETNGETDYAPSGVVIMEGEVEPTEPGRLSGQMSGQYTTRLGEQKNPTARITILLAEDQATF
ncbi:MAG: hypothetical protein JW797_06945 [Bradymonadales bacterium]|nr:hypothetical protein [Bradymonadales bacterium]